MENRIQKRLGEMGEELKAMGADVCLLLVESPENIHVHTVGYWHELIRLAIKSGDGLVNDVCKATGMSKREVVAQALRTNPQALGATISAKEDGGNSNIDHLAEFVKREKL